MTPSRDKSAYERPTVFGEIPRAPARPERSATDRPTSRRRRLWPRAPAVRSARRPARNRWGRSETLTPRTLRVAGERCLRVGLGLYAGEVVHVRPPETGRSA